MAFSIHIDTLIKQLSHNIFNFQKYYLRYYKSK
jgi:hypothetical protein